MDEKIAKLYQNLKTEGVDDIRANDIIQKVKERQSWGQAFGVKCCRKGITE